MPTRAQVGSPDGVTNASMTPLTSSTSTRPSATVPAVRPSRASAWVRDRSPGSTQDQNSRKPTPPATKTAVSSRRPWGRISPQNSSPRSWRIMIEPMIARLAMLSKSTFTSGRPRIPSPRHRAVTQALLIHTCAAKWLAAYWL